MQRRTVVASLPTDGDVVMVATPPVSKRKRQDVIDYNVTPFGLLLRTWKLQDVEDILKSIWGLIHKFFNYKSVDFVRDQKIVPKN